MIAQAERSTAEFVAARLLLRGLIVADPHMKALIVAAQEMPVPERYANVDRRDWSQHPASQALQRAREALARDADAAVTLDA